MANFSWRQIFCCRQVLVLVSSQVIFGDMFVSFWRHTYEDKEVLDE